MINLRIYRASLVLFRSAIAAAMFSPASRFPRRAKRANHEQPDAFDG